MSLPAYNIIEASPEWADAFRGFSQVNAQAAYARPELGVTADLFSREAYAKPAVVAHFAGICAVSESVKAWIALDDQEEIIGTVSAQERQDQCELQALYVATELKGKGLGRVLYDRVLDFAGSMPIRLDVIAYMQETIDIYEHLGFVIDPTAGRPNYVFDWPEAARQACHGIYMFKPGVES